MEIGKIFELISDNLYASSLPGFFVYNVQVKGNNVPFWNH